MCQRDRELIECVLGPGWGPGAGERPYLMQDEYHNKNGAKVHSYCNYYNSAIEEVVIFTVSRCLRVKWNYNLL